MNEHSFIYSYDRTTHETSQMHLNYDYLSGSHGLNWKGVIIEKLHSLDAFSQEIYYNDYIFFVSLGDIDFYINDHLIDTSSDDVFINPMKSPYKIDINHPITGIILSLSHEFIKSHFHDLQLDSVNFIKSYQIHDNNLNYLIKLILEQAQAKTKFEDPFLNQLFKTFVMYFINNFSDYHTIEGEHVLNQSCLIRIDQYIDDNYDNDISYKDISCLSGMSSYNFLKEFKALTNYTPHQYILNRKLQRAKQLLMTSPLSITEMSYELGFTDSSHFSKFFKKHMNISPSLYREQEHLKLKKPY